jgi:signal transduction histidine kinase
VHTTETSLQQVNRGPAVNDSTQADLKALQEFLTRQAATAGKKHRGEFQAALTHLEHLAHALDEGDEQARLAMLYDVSRALGSSLQLDRVLNFAMDAVIELTGAERGFLMLTHPDSGDLDLMVARNMERKTLDREDMQVSRSLINDVIQKGEGIVTTNALRDERFSDKESVVMFALRSILCVPLRTRGKSIGVLYVDNKVKSGVFNESDKETLEAFATQAAAAIENARVYTQADTALAARIEELEQLQRIDRELNTSMDFQRVIDLTLSWAIRGTHADQGWLAMREASNNSMVIVAGDGKGVVLDMDALGLQDDVVHDTPMRRSDAVEYEELLVAPVRREDEVIACIGVMRAETRFTDAEVTFLQRLADHASAAIENTRLYKAVQEANLAKSEFVSAVSHELRIPMTSISGYADLILKGKVGPITEQQARYLDNIRSNVSRMNALVSDLSDISRIETGQLTVAFTEVHIAKYIRETAANLKPMLDAKSQQLVFDLPEDLPGVSTDRTRLVQILTNLLSNAIKYTPNEGYIKIRAALLGNGEVKVSIQDNGIGISKQEMDQLFRQFFRSENPMVREQSGWGLGLHVTHRLVSLLGGKVGVESELEKGSTFWFTLPIADQSAIEGTV